MPAIITWNLKRGIHTGSAEVNGVPGKPFAFQHPQDSGGTPVKGPFASWRYNQADYTNDGVVAGKLDLTVKGGVSYRKYRRLFVVAQNWGGPLPDPWAGQEGAPTVFQKPQATAIQPSGFAIYEAHLSLQPPSPKDEVVSVTGSMFCLCASVTAWNAKIGGSATIESQAKLFDNKGEVARIHTLGKVPRRFHLKWKRKGKTYDVTIPAGRAVKVGEIIVGLGYMIGAGWNRFFCRSSLRFVTSGATPVGEGEEGH